MRKEADFEVMDKICVSFSGNEKIAEIVKKNADSIKDDVLAEEIVYNTALSYKKSWNINGEETEISVEQR